MIYVRLDKSDKPFGEQACYDALLVCRTYIAGVRASYAVNKKIKLDDYQLLDMNYPVKDKNVPVEFLAKMSVVVEYMGYFMAGIKKYPDIIANNSQTDALFTTMFKKLVESEGMPTMQNLKVAQTPEEIVEIFGGMKEMEPLWKQLAQFIAAYDYQGQAYLGMKFGVLPEQR